MISCHKSVISLSFGSCQYIKTEMSERVSLFFFIGFAVAVVFPNDNVLSYTDTEFFWNGIIEEKVKMKKIRTIVVFSF